MRSMADQAFPSDPPPPLDAIAFYIGGEVPHIWSDAEIDAQPARYRLPIFTRINNFGDPAGDATDIVAWAMAHDLPPGSTVALDLETQQVPSYVAEVDTIVTTAGWVTMVYGSLSTVGGNGHPSGGLWIADWTGAAHQVPGAAATQWADAALLGQPWDESLVGDTVDLWDTQAPVQPPPPPVRPVIAPEDQMGIYHVVVQPDPTLANPTAVLLPSPHSAQFGDVIVNVTADNFETAQPVEVRLSIGSASGWRFPVPGADVNGYVPVPTGSPLVFGAHPGDRVLSVLVNGSKPVSVQVLWAAGPNPI
jgi:hypothetical protein